MEVFVSFVIGSCANNDMTRIAAPVNPTTVSMVGACFPKRRRGHISNDLLALFIGLPERYSIEEVNTPHHGYPIRFGRTNGIGWITGLFAEDAPTMPFFTPVVLFDQTAFVEFVRIVGAFDYLLEKFLVIAGRAVPESILPSTLLLLHLLDPLPRRPRGATVTITITITITIT